MKGFYDNIERATLANSKFRQVVYTGKHMQLVLMCLQPNENIGQEVHSDNDQFFRFESGHGRVIVDDEVYEVNDGSAVIVPAGAKHDIANTSNTDTLQFYTLYAPPHHKDGIIHETKDDASANDQDFEGDTTE